MVGGRLADRYGPRTLFVVAMAAFGLFSAAGGLAGERAVLLAARGAQGLAAAVLQPAVLALIGLSFRAGETRNRALVVWGSVGASGLAAGVVLGGLLTSASWRWTFAINVPLALAAVLGARYLPAARPGTEPAPVLASLLGTGAVLAIVLGLTVLWTPLFVLSGLLLLAFLRVEATARRVLIPRPLRRIGSLRVGVAATALYMAGVGSEFYLVTLLLQDNRGYGPLRAGLAFLPLAAMVTAGNSAAGRAVRRWSAPVVLAAGFLLAALGLAGLVVAQAQPGYAVLLPGLLLSGFGHGVIYTAMFIIGTRDVPAGHQGVAGSLLTTSQYVSGAVTVAVLTLVLDRAGFAAAFGVTAGAALAGAVLAGVFAKVSYPRSRMRAWTSPSNRGTSAGPLCSAASMPRR
jgi:MFS family permease